MISAKINCSKNDKTKLFKGEKGTYLDIVLIETPNGEYGDYLIVQELSKAERDAGKKGNILGNAKMLQQRQRAAPPKPKAAPKADDEDSGVPF